MMETAKCPGLSRMIEPAGHKRATILAHRVSTIADVDRKVMPKDGRVTESGPHKEPCKEKGRYFRRY
ncbi:MULTISPECIES: hypothetical protein [unclassified Methanoculleus]|jgi:ABC-type transport system involved in Fe-S cluster assembly fused permease/ATPase subunit|uniref:hypothetical protein n=1 Tax=unclassified Methanoculleus TaxID=2619537 RepID=UPI0025DB6197|nr:hypothetical protein [Methanoculleus sp. UBA377]MDD2473293.1 hypothetical protein [Methanoculleus sp.]